MLRGFELHNQTVDDPLEKDPSDTINSSREISTVGRFWRHALLKPPGGRPPQWGQDISPVRKASGCTATDSVQLRKPVPPSLSGRGPTADAYNLPERPRSTGMICTSAGRVYKVTMGVLISRAALLGHAESQRMNRLTPWKHIGSPWPTLPRLAFDTIGGLRGGSARWALPT